MRFIAAQFEALLADGLWLRNATHANAMARRLADGAALLPHVQITQPVQSNAVFAILPEACTAALQASFPFYVWNEATAEVRWMTAWDTTPDDVEAFAAGVRRLVGDAVTDRFPG
jgi:threonine aldolase